MRVLFLVSDKKWSARARAFTNAARGLIAKGHETLLACESDCPVQVRAVASQLQIVPLDRDASAAGSAWTLRRTLQDRSVDVVFVHTDAEHFIASSAVRLGRGGAAVIRRIPPFAVLTDGRKARFASRIVPSGLLFSTQADRDAAGGGAAAIPAAVAPLAVDLSQHDQVKPVARGDIGVPQNARLMVCVNDGLDKQRVYAALRTLALLVPRHPDLHLAVVGVSAVDELRMHAAALGVSPRVTFLGSREDELSIMRAADVGWLAADGDAAAFAALDFMAFGVPVLAERSALTEHYVADGIGGKLLDPGDAMTTSASVAAFLAADDQRAAMGKAGRARLQREFSFEAMISGFEQAITGATERGARKVS